MKKDTKNEVQEEKKKESNATSEGGVKKVDQTGPAFIGLSVLSLLIVCCIFVLPHFVGILGTIILSLIIIPIAAFLVLWFGLAPSMVIGTFIPEGYCIMITRGQEKGEFVKAMIKWKGHAINNNYDIVEMKSGEEEMDFSGFWDRSHFGMNFYFWPFDKVYSYDLEWKQFSHDEKVINKSEHLYYVLLKPYVYYIDIKNAEDKTKVPQNMGIVAEMRVVNPYKATFMIQNWYRAVSNLIIGDLRDFIRNKSYEELINPESGKSSLNEMIWDQITKNGLAKNIEDKYGVRIIKLTVVEIGPADDEYSRATLRKIIAEKNQEAIKVEAQSEAYKRSTETMGLATRMFLDHTKMEEETMKDLLLDNPEEFNRKYGEIFNKCLDLVQREMALAKGRFIDIRTDAAGVKGGDSLLALIAANSMLNNQSSSTGGKSVSKKKDNEEDFRF
ncbi:MAG: SPFH domain-containing protein [Candidatus Pacearchaeota archaeon]